MENNVSEKSTKRRSSRLESNKQSKMIRRFYNQFLEILSRKTESEKRIELFGKDPFK
jgi:hypothetical protein